MTKIFITIVVQISAYASILGLYLTVKPLSEPRPGSHWFFLGCGLVLAIYLLFKEVKDQLSVKTKIFDTEIGIKNYMCKWISSPGRTLVFSRDLSWGSEPGTKSTLLNKSKRSELTIFIEKETALSAELSKAGATIQLYGPTGFIPESRFTIVGAGKQGARVAVGLLENGKHVVYQFESGKHPVFALAKDLALLASRVGTTS
ncbi:hypothetical protein [Sphingomonas sp. Leaf226]|uniref:hypothetical protein n=1 Tax=Sphingomonas sp. Leaf226 TaxID=1735691 RepID=UPI0012E1C709|nr:hypothetical protein [Sphingomonas sp. Leaf226]